VLALVTSDTNIVNDKISVIGTYSFWFQGEGGGVKLQDWEKPPVEGTYSQHFPSLLINPPNKQVLHNPRLKSLASDKNSGLLGPFIRYKENEVL
jgi:hypothetical protein